MNNKKKNSDYAIRVTNVTKTFKLYYDKPNTLKERIIFWKGSKKELKTVLSDVSLDIKRGESVALIGVNGCGKSTLLKMMTKIIYPNSGSIVVNGKLTSLLELGAGFHQDFTGRENIYFNASIFGLTSKEIDNKIESIIGFSELGEYIDSPVRTYSSGMYMRLAFSIAINVEADILLIDEILAVGDKRFQEKCFDKLLELKNSGKTIVVVSHDFSSIKKVCDRAIWIKEGQIYDDGPIKEITQNYLKEVKKGFDNDD